MQISNTDTNATANKAPLPLVEDQDKIAIEWNNKDEYLQLPNAEVATNGYKSFICLTCWSWFDDECNHNANSLINIVENKVDSMRFN